MIPFWRTQAGLGVKLVGLGLSFAGITVLVAEFFLRPMSTYEHDWASFAHVVGFIVYGPLCIVGLMAVLTTSRSGGSAGPHHSIVITIHCPHCHAGFKSWQVPAKTGESFTCPVCNRSIRS